MVRHWRRSALKLRLRKRTQSIHVYYLGSAYVEKGAPKVQKKKGVVSMREKHGGKTIPAPQARCEKTFILGKNGKYSIEYYP